MTDHLVLTGEERLAERPFTHPEHSKGDLTTMRYMAQQLIDNYGDPAICDFLPGKRAVCKSDPKGRHFRIYYIRPRQLFQLENLTAVGFFGAKRSQADVKPLIRADKQFETVFDQHPGLLSLSTARLPGGDFANLVLFTDPEAKDRWNYSQPHYETVQQISPPYYQYVRLNNAVFPEGLNAPGQLELSRVKYIDYNTDPPWRAVRNFS